VRRRVGRNSRSRPWEHRLPNGLRSQVCLEFAFAVVVPVFLFLHVLHRHVAASLRGGSWE
jgi:hypothetical protein